VSPAPLRIACIGRAGQTAQALASVAARDPRLELIAAGRETLDLKAPASLARFLDATTALCGDQCRRL